MSEDGNHDSDRTLKIVVQPFLFKWCKLPVGVHTLFALGLRAFTSSWFIKFCLTYLHWKQDKLFTVLVLKEATSLEAEKPADFRLKKKYSKLLHWNFMECHKMSACMMERSRYIAVRLTLKQWLLNLFGNWFGVKNLIITFLKCRFAVQKIWSYRKLSQLLLRICMGGYISCLKLY